MKWLSLIFAFAISASAQLPLQRLPLPIVSSKKASADFVTDTFTDSNGTALSSHTGEVGATWTIHPSYPSILEIQSNRVTARSGVEANLGYYYASGVPPSADYYVQATVHMATGSVNFHYAGIVGRMSTSADTFYIFYFGQVEQMWTLQKRLAGVGTTLGTQGATLADNSDTIAKMVMSGNSIKCYTNGVELFNVTDSDIAAPGKAAVASFWSVAQGQLTVDNFSAR